MSDEEQEDAKVIALEYFQLGVEKFLEGMHKQAIASFKEAVRLNKEDADAWYNLGVTYMEMNELNASIDALRKAITIHLNHEEAHYRLGCVYFMAGEVEKAVKEYSFLSQIESPFGKPLHALLNIKEVKKS